VATCPPEVTDCAFRVGVYAAFGAVPVIARTKKTKTAKLLGSATLTLQAGKQGRIKIHFNAAGKQALRAGRSLKVRIKVDVTAGAQHGSFTSSTTISAPHSHKGKHKKR
jgi:hypothetical protein